jgi:hypothetical protein
MPTSLPAVAAHGAVRLPSVEVDSYNVEDDEGFLGDRASKGAFRQIVENWRAALRKAGEDPFGADEELSRRKLDRLLERGTPEAKDVMQGATQRIAGYAARPAAPQQTVYGASGAGSVRAKQVKLAPFIGIGCPGKIEPDGSIDRGAQNLPGNWESSKFNLSVCLHELVPRIGDEETAFVMHNNAVVQGLSEVPYMRDVERWGVFTIGTGLGNARFTYREAEGER